MLCIGRYIATGETFRSLAFQFRISHCYLSKIVKATLDAIIESFMNEALPEPTTEMFTAIAATYFEKWNYPNCIGANRVSGKHNIDTLQL